MYQVDSAAAGDNNAHVAENYYILCGSELHAGVCDTYFRTESHN